MITTAIKLAKENKNSEIYFMDDWLNFRVVVWNGSELIIKTLNGEIVEQII